jgi:hypothetical protein
VTGQTNNTTGLVGIEPNPGPKRRSKTSSNSGKMLALASDNNINPFKAVLHTIDEKQNAQTYRHRLVNSANCAASVTGLNTIIPLNGIQNALDWSSFATLYDEFRVLGARVHYQPQNRYTTNNNPIVFYYDNDNTTLTPTTNNQALSYANCDYINTSTPHVYDGIAVSTRDGPEIWCNTGTPNSQLGMVALFTTTSFGSSFTCGQVFIEYIAEFRGRR